MQKNKMQLFDIATLNQEIKEHKNTPNDSEYFRKNRYARALSVITSFVSDDQKLSDADLDVMRQYVKCFGRLGGLRMSSIAKQALQIIKQRQNEAKKAAVKQPRYVLEKRKKTKNKKLYEYKDAKTLRREAKQKAKAQKPARTSLFASLSNGIKKLSAKMNGVYQKATQKLGKSRKYAIYPLIGLISLGGSLWGAQKLSSSKNTKEKIENTQKAKHSQIIASSGAETTVFTPVQSEVVPQRDKQDTTTSKIEQARKNYYDTALEIHLGVQKRDALYAAVAQQIEKGNFKPEQGTSVEKIAHSLTMYQLLAPNSQANQFLQQMLHADQTNSVEQNKMNHLVAQTANLKGSGQHSNFDKQNPELQKRHLQNVQTLRQLSR